MAQKQKPARTSSTGRSSAPVQQPPVRSGEVMRCENCGEDFSITYKRCPFCDERPGRTGIGGRRAAGGAGVHPIQLVGLVATLVLIIAACFIVFRMVAPFFRGEGATSSQGSASSGGVDSSGSASGSLSGSASGSAAASGSASSGGDVSQPQQPPVGQTATSITLNRLDFTLTAGEVFQLTATVTPADNSETITWSSANPALATVDEYGNVTNVNQGATMEKTMITATCGTQSVQCTVYARAKGAQTPPTTTDTPTKPPAAQTVTPNTQGTIVNAGNGLNVRSGPGRDNDVVASISNGEKITILEDAGNGWYKISYTSSKTGYVSSDYVSTGG